MNDNKITLMFLSQVCHNINTNVSTFFNIVNNQAPCAVMKDDDDWCFTATFVHTVG